MTATCQTCTAPSPNAWLCKRCATNLHDMLRDLVWWIDRLAEAAVGDVRMSDGPSRVYSSRYPINGEHNVAHYLACFPGDSDTLPDDTALNKRYDAARRRALAAGKVNERASALFADVTDTLTMITRDLRHSRGIPIRNVRAYPPSFIGALQIGAIRCDYRGKTQFYAQWLSEHVPDLIMGEEAGQIHTDIHNLVGDTHHEGRICKAVNRPIPMRYLGNCPTWHEEHRKACGAELWCRADAVEVFCKTCRCAHNPDRLQLLMVNDAEREKVTIKRVLELNRMLPTEYRINERTLRRWRSIGPKGEPPKLKTRGYIRPCSCNHKHSEHSRSGECGRCDDCSGFDGREAITQRSEDDEPLYLWADVRKLRVESGKVTA